MAKCLETDMKRDTLFTEFKKMFEVESNTLDFLAYLKHAVPNVFSGN